MARRLTLKDPQQEQRLFTRRVIIAIIGVCILSFLLSLRLAYLQLDQTKLYTTLSNENQLNLVPIAPNRGLIYDRNGVLLAENLPVFSLEVIPDKVVDLNKMIAALQAVVKISPEEIQAFHKQLKQRRRFEEIPLRLRLTPAEVARFYVNQYRFPGVVVNARLLRYYPLGSAMVNVLGYVGRINERELLHVNRTNYSATNYIGKVGIEKYYEKQLHGTVGYEQVETDASGRIVRVLQRTPPIPGDNLHLTIDSGLQIVAEEALAGHRGAVVAIQPKTGQILSLVSNPSYDPNPFVTGISHKAFQTLQSSPDQPLYNRAIRGQYPLGSTIKPFLALEGLATNTVTPKTRIFDKGYFQLNDHTRRYRDWKKGGHGWINIDNAIIQSCDTYFYELSLKLGINRIGKIMREFGFGSATGIDMGEELPGLVPSPEWKLKTLGAHWYAGDTINSVIGQGYMLATPLQLASATATLAMHGERFRPYILSKASLPGGISIDQAPIPEPPVRIPQRDWNNVIKAMQGVIFNPRGTGIRFGKPKYSVAAKTGTAQVFSLRMGEEYNIEDIPKNLRDNSAFIVFAPVEHPQIAVAVMVQNSMIAPNVARKVIDYYLHQLQKHKQLQARKKHSKVNS